MNNNDSNDRDMERQLEQHFASGADKVPPTPDLWASLEGRLGEQDPKPVWAGIRDWAFPPGGFNGVPPIAATAAAVVVVAIAGSVWFAVGGRDVRHRNRRGDGNCGKAGDYYRKDRRDRRSRESGGGQDRKSRGNGDCGNTGDYDREDPRERHSRESGGGQDRNSRGDGDRGKAGDSR